MSTQGNQSKDVFASEERVDSTIGRDRDVWALSFSPNGKILAGATRKGTVVLWALQSPPLGLGVEWKKKTEIVIGRRTYSVTFAPHRTSTTMVATTEDGRIHFWSIGVEKESLTTSKVAVLTGHSEHVWCCAFTDDCQYLASASNDRSVVIWRESTTGIEPFVYEQRLSKHSFSCVTCAFRKKTRRGSGQYASVDGYASGSEEILASGSYDGSVILWEKAQMWIPTCRLTHAGWVFSCAFSGCGRYLCAGVQDRSCKIWRLGDERKMCQDEDEFGCKRECRLAATVPAAAGVIESVAFARKDNALVTGSQYGPPVIWTYNKVLREGEGVVYFRLNQILTPTPPPSLQSVNGDQYVGAPERQRGSQKHWGSSQKHQGSSRQVCISNDSRFIGVCESDGYVRVWRRHDDRLEQIAQKLVSVDGEENVLGKSNEVLMQNASRALSLLPPAKEGETRTVLDIFNQARSNMSAIEGRQDVSLALWLEQFATPQKTQESEDTKLIHALLRAASLLGSIAKEDHEILQEELNVLEELLKPLVLDDTSTSPQLTAKKQRFDGVRMPDGRMAKMEISERGTATTKKGQARSNKDSTMGLSSPTARPHEGSMRREVTHF